MRCWRKILKYTMVSLIAIFITWKYVLPTQLYIKLGDSDVSTRIKVPYWIVVTKDCKALKDWSQEQGIPQIALLIQNGCPWDKDVNKKDRKYANYTMNGVKLRIPIEELVYKDKPDGETSLVYLHLLYPELKALPPSTPLFVPNDGCKADKKPILNPDDLNYIAISSETADACHEEGVCGKHSCKTKEVCDSWVRDFRGKIGVWANKDIKTKEISMKLIKKNSKYGADIYKESGLTCYDEGVRDCRITLGMDYFILGENPLEPDYWVECNSELADVCHRRPVCSTGYSIANGKLGVTYTFMQQKFLPIHLELRKAMEQKLNSYIIN